ncbi:diguanylate cyclase [Demequina zhanjiangensis]|uniref:Diguanylate cyclase n=1 Tax=Demequina zhanjiangensis TaxID=3051659 RepID=A0ABT8G3V6_9MICO|nr:diguanylate cyclase [Demequina sp. SYSU T00b26]MDN4473707.1 diguanylate cyclase [Demequina sp. SYSU T00b26]
MTTAPAAPARRRRLPFVVGVVVVDVVLAVQVALSIWTGVEARTGVAEAIEDTFTYVADVSAASVSRYVDASESTTASLVLWMEREDPSPDEVAERLLALRAANSELRAIAVAYPDGSWVGVAPDKQEGSAAEYVVATAVADGNGGGTYTLEGYSRTLAPVERREQPWSVDAVALGFWDAAALSYDLVWTDPALRPVTGEGGAWAAQRVLADDGGVAAVVGTDFSLDALARELNSLPLGDDGEVYLLDAQRRVLAAPAVDQERVDEGFAEGAAPSAASFDLRATDAATPYEIAVQFGTNGDLRTAERGLNDVGVPWVLHLEASDESLAPAVASLAWVLHIATVVSLLVLLAAVAVYVVVWKPLLEMQRAAYTDVLTGLLTRRRFEQFAGEAIQNAHRMGGHACVVVLDIDHFKQINDTHGHKAGDAALALVGETLSRHVRQDDLVSRWGGDEFVVLMVMKPGKDGTSAMERLRASAQQALREAFPDQSDLGITAGGSASVSGSSRIDDLVRVADDALVAGKQVAKATSYAASL